MNRNKHLDRNKLLCYRRRVLFPLELVAAAIMIAGLAFMFGGGQKGVETAYAQQAGATLVSNLGQEDSTTVEIAISDTARAQAFRTGSGIDGFEVTEIQARMKISDHAKLQASIHPDAGFKPGAKIGDFLTGPTANNSTLETVSFNAVSDINLAQNTWYWAVFECTTSATCAVMVPTTSNSEDAGAASGWSIDTKHYQEPSTSGTNWASDANNKLQVSVNGFVLGADPIENLRVTALESTARVGERVALDYTPGSHPIRDLAGNSADALTDESAMNETRTNILLITVDDMNWDSVGVYGSPVKGATPNIDRLAAEGMRFVNAHVTTAVCLPGRRALLTGRYPHLSGGEGFDYLSVEGVAHLPAILRNEGYAVGVLSKIKDMTPYANFRWDMEKGPGELGQGRNPEAYYQHAKTFVQEAIDDDRPFFLSANSNDPHRAFHGNDPHIQFAKRPIDPDRAAPSRAFTPEEVTVPGFLPDIPDVRLEISEYYSSVRRADDTVGRLLDMLDDTGAAENTLVMFVSDHGIAVPFGKGNVWMNSTRTPWVARWPGVIKSGSVDTEHFISSIDYMPTVLDALGIDIPTEVNGKSFLPLLRGESQNGRERVFTQLHELNRRGEFPMRSVQDARFGYIINPWSDGARAYLNSAQTHYLDRTWKAMQDAAVNDPELAARVHFFTYRVPEEFYDYKNDPNALNNLIDDPEYANEIQDMRDALNKWMKETNDPLLKPMVSDTSALRAYTVVLGESFSVTLPAADADSGSGGPYDYSLWQLGQLGQPASFIGGIDGIAFNPTTRVLSGTPRKTGLYRMDYVVHDGDKNRKQTDAFRNFTDLRVEVIVTETTSQVEGCFTQLGTLTGEQYWVGEWFWDPAHRYLFSGSYSLSDICNAHHRAESPARYFHFSLDEPATVVFDLAALEVDSAVALYVSNDTPNNPWGTPPVNTYAQRVQTRLAKGKLVHNSAPQATLQLPAGSYTAEAAAASVNADTFKLSIRVQDSTGPEQSNSEPEPPANRAPAFAGATATRDVAENSGGGVTVGAAVTATDPDSDTLTYSLSGTDASSFAIGASTGQITTVANVNYDHETKSAYSLTVEATDGNGGTATIAVTVSLTNVNEAPAFAGSSATREVAENSGGGVNVGAAVTAADPDSDTLTYSLSGTDAASFEIGGSTGQITTKSGEAYDYETKSSYSLTVEATDGNGGTATIAVTVSLTNVNEAPVFGEGGADESGVKTTTRQVAENSPGGTNVGAALTATDPENDTLTYSLSGTDASSFAIGASTGQITTKSGEAYDYETKSSYSLSVTAVDGKGGTTSIAVTVNLTDANEAPVFGEGGADESGVKTTTRQVAENSGGGVNVGAPVTATDPDSDTLTYSLSGTDASSFAIGASTGQITTVANVNYDYETKSSYSLTVKASDGDGLSDSIALTVNLTNVEETLPNRAPAFASESATRQVAENSAGGVNVGAPVTATDPDDDTLTYSLSGTDASSFAIGASTGQITTVANVNYDHETKPSYSLTVEASDGELTDSIAVTVNLTDVNEAPAFAASSATLEVAENSGGGVNVGAPVTATDPDDDALTYTLSGTDASSFAIGASTGQVTTVDGETYDYETKPSYSLTVKATDEDGLSGSITVTVNPTNVDEAPTVSDTTQFRNHAATVRQPFSLTLPAADANSGDGAPYEYLLWHRGQGQNFMDQAVNGLRFNAVTRTLSGTPATAGVWKLSYVVHDNDANRSVADRFRARTHLQITVSE